MPGLIITNGDSAAYGLRDAGRTDTILPWRDVLHEGPILPGALDVCSAARVEYLAARFRIPEPEIAAEFAERDALMRRHSDFDQIELWFEHDLYDQLQLIQLLDFFAGTGRTEGLTLVQADDFLGAERATTILRFAVGARALTAEDMALGRDLWAAITSSTPEAVAAEVDRLGDDRLRFARTGLIRFLEELPAPDSGLSRTEQTILSAINGGTSAPLQLFPQVIQQEEAAFMGDTSFFAILDDLGSCDVPLIAGLAPASDGDGDSDRFREAELELTMAGEDVLAGEEDHLLLSGLRRWWGGTWLECHETWRFDRGARSLVAPGREG